MIKAGSARIEKMVRYHRIQAKKRRLSDKLESKARFFVRRVNEILTPGENHWAKALQSGRDGLVRKVMFNEDPFCLAQKAGRIMDEQNLLDLGKKRDVQRHAEELQSRGKSIQKTREKYLLVQGEVEKINAGPHASKYDAVSDVRSIFRDRYYGEGLGPLIRIDRLQETIRPDLNSESKAGSSCQERTLGQTALQNMAESNSPLDSTARSEEQWDETGGRDEKELEEAAWALYLFVASGGDHPAGPAKHEVQGEKIPCRPEVIMRN